MNGPAGSRICSPLESPAFVLATSPPARECSHVFKAGMKTQSPDTSVEAETFLIERLRAAGPQRRFEMARDASRTIRQLAWSGLRRRHPHADGAELRRRYAALTLGEEAATHFLNPARPT